MRLQCHAGNASSQVKTCRAEDQLGRSFVGEVTAVGCAAWRAVSFTRSRDVGSSHIRVLFRDHCSGGGAFISNWHEARREVCAQGICLRIRGHVPRVDRLLFRCTLFVPQVPKSAYFRTHRKCLYPSSRRVRGFSDLVSLPRLIKAILLYRYDRFNRPVSDWARPFLPTFYLGVSKGSPADSD